MPQAEYVLRLLEKSEIPNWDIFNHSAPGGGLFYSSRWAEILSEVLERPYKILVVQKNEVIKGGILFWPKKVGMVRTITRMPFTPYQGILLAASTREKPSSQISETADVLRRLILKLKTDYHFIDITSSPVDVDMRPYIWQGCQVAPVYTYIFPPMKERSSRADTFSQALRRKIAVSRKQDLEIIESDEAGYLIDFVFASYRFHKTIPPLARNRLLLFIEHLLKSSLAKIFYLKEKKISAGLMIAQDDKNIYALMSGMNPAERANSFSEYLHAAVMSRPEFQGRQFDFLGANTETFEQFKRSFGGSLQPYYRINYTKTGIVKSLQILRERYHRFRRRTL